MPRPLSNRPSQAPAKEVNREFASVERRDKRKKSDQAINLRQEGHIKDLEVLHCICELLALYSQLYRSKLRVYAILRPP